MLPVQELEAALGAGVTPAQYRGFVAVMEAIERATAVSLKAKES